MPRTREPLRVAPTHCPLVAWEIQGTRRHDAVDREVARQALMQPRPGHPGATPHRQRGATRKVLAGIAGGVGGFLLGGYVGAKIEGDRCNCDDPGLQGFVIGAPIGAIAGAILGAGFL